ncbi:MAG: hypothetical protein ACLGI9_06575, partial [Thermoanaerobaculia bacterium]
MTNQIRRAVAICLAAASLAGTAQSAEPAQKDPGAERLEKAFEEAERQREVLEDKMYEHLKRMPDKFDPAFEEARIRRIAAEVEELDTLEIKRVPEAERLRLADGRISPVEVHRMEISGHAPFSRVHMLLVWMQAATWRLAELETLRLAAREGDAVTFSARVAYPTYVGWKEGGLGGGPWASTEDMLR